MTVAACACGETHTQLGTSLPAALLEEKWQSQCKPLASLPAALGTTRGAEAVVGSRSLPLAPWQAGLEEPSPG